MNLLDSIAKFCSDHSTTFTEVEEACGFEKGTLLKWDKKSPSIEKAHKVAIYFGLTLDELIKGKRSKKKINPIPLKERLAVGVDEASFLLSTNVQAIYKLVKDGELTTILVNGTKKIPVKVLEEYQSKLLKQGA